MANVQGSSFLLSAANVTWGRRERTCIDINVAETVLDGKHFEIDAPDSHGGVSAGYYVWFNLDSLSIDPAVTGRTGIMVSIATGDTAEEVATKLETALEAEAKFRARVTPSDKSQVNVDPEFVGSVDQATTDGDTGLKIAQLTSGLGGDLGKTSGGVEVTMEASSVEITSDQTAGLVLDEVFTGSKVEVSVSLLEMTSKRWETIVASVTGDKHTPAGGSQLIGYGESRLYQSFFDLGGQLILHPTRKAADDRAFDITLWKSAPKPSSINFSGEEPQVMEVTFTALADREVVDSINLMAFGDSEQDVRS